MIFDSKRNDPDQWSEILEALDAIPYACEVSGFVGDCEINPKWRFDSITGAIDTCLGNDTLEWFFYRLEDFYKLKVITDDKTNTFILKFYED